MIRVLLVDHSLEHPNSIRGFLDDSVSSHLIVDCVTTHAEILKGLRSHTYDVCILDSLLDNGIKLFAQARSLNFTVPIVLVVCDSAGVAVEAMRNGVADCLVRDQLTPSRIEQVVCEVAERTRHSFLQTQRERRLLALLDNFSDIVFTHDLKGNFTSINRAGQRLIGYGEAEIMKMKLEQVVMPQFQKIIVGMISRALDAQSQASGELELRTKEGKGLSVELNIHPIQHQGLTVEIQGVARQTLASPRFTTGWALHKVDDDKNHSNDCCVMAIPDKVGSISLPVFNG